MRSGLSAFPLQHIRHRQNYMNWRKCIPDVLRQNLTLLSPRIGSGLTTISLASLHCVLSVFLLVFAAKATPDAANAREGVAKISVKLASISSHNNELTEFCFGFHGH